MKGFIYSENHIYYNILWHNYIITIKLITIYNIKNKMKD